MSRPLRVALMYDQKSWVLECISKSIQKHASCESRLLLDPIPPVRHRRDLIPIKRNYDVLHYMSPGDFYRLGSSTPMPTVVTIHHVASRIRDRFNRLGHYADVICTINAEVEANLDELDGIRGIPRRRTDFGIDTSLFRPRQSGRARLLEVTGFPPDSIILGMASKKDNNEDERKGFDRLWRMLEHLREQCKVPVRLVLFGPASGATLGWETSDIPDSIREMVVLPGYLSADDLAECFSGLDFYVCLSRIEGGPYPVMEAMASGVRVISTPVGIVPELIRDEENGFLVNSENFLERITAIVTSEPIDEQRKGAMCVAARRTIKEKREWASLTSTELYLGIYAEALARYQARPLSQKIPRHFRLKWAAVARQRK